ncbi:hypothetical protein NOGI109294_19120 [Nocardiopsis gilva]|uniref:hypothetical protein n=1 Tax=Nocardiopsis gilva TaxID=280236 RepID=UPI00126934A0|nr:hypothetical protein [Nocardiopsis gilva]
MMHSLRFLALVMCVTIATACDAFEETTINEDEASEQIERYVNEAVDVLPEQARLEPLGSSTSAPCDEGRIDWVNVERSYWVEDLPKEDAQRNIELIYDHWEESGYELVSESKSDDVTISFKNPEDSFTMDASVNGDGAILISVISPCIWAEGTPQ